MKQNPTGATLLYIYYYSLFLEYQIFLSAKFREAVFPRQKYLLPCLFELASLWLCSWWYGFVRIVIDSALSTSICPVYTQQLSLRPACTKVDLKYPQAPQPHHKSFSNKSLTGHFDGERYGKAVCYTFGQNYRSSLKESQRQGSKHIDKETEKQRAL